MGKSSTTVKDPFKTMYRGVQSSKKKDGMHRPEGAGNFDNMDDYNQVQSININEIAGKPVFVGGGLPYGEIYASDNSTETVIAVQNTWVQITIFDTDGDSNNTTPDNTEDHITITKAGHYYINCTSSCLSGTGSGFNGEFEVKLNNGTVDLEDIHTDRDLSGGGGDHGSISMAGIHNMAVGDTIEVWVRNKTNTTNVIFEDISLTIFQIGG